VVVTGSSQQHVTDIGTRIFSGAKSRRRVFRERVTGGSVQMFSFPTGRGDR